MCRPPLPRGWIARRCGVVQRHWADVDGGETNAFMGAAAVRDALADAGLGIEALDCIINASATPMRMLPDNACFIQAELGLGSSGIPAFSINAACLSFIVALDVAAALLLSGRYRTIAVVSAEVTSPGLNFADPETASLFGDAAAAAIVTLSAPGEASALSHAVHETFGEAAELTTVRGGGTVRPPHHPETRDADNRFAMAGPAVLAATLARSVGFLERIKPGLAHGLPGVSLVIPHQPSKAAMKNAMFFGWDDKQVVSTLGALGNCVAASVPCTLVAAVRTGRLRRGETALLVGSGAGLSLGGMLLTF